ncbi:MAG TPA: hypothetical protein VIF83_15875 [Gemmatimonadaceae bacterium]
MRVVRKAGHETRNRLNGLAVNLEVVRSRLAKARSAQSNISDFAEQAVSESEAVVSMTEGIIALLELSVGAVDEHGAFRCSIVEPDGVSLEASREVIRRVMPRLIQLSNGAGFRVESSETAVILTFPVVQPEE